MTDEQHDDGTSNGHGGWQPIPQGEYDADATAFVQLPEGMADFDPAAGTPLAAPGHGYVPPEITAAQAAAGSPDPAGHGAWGMPGGQGMAPHEAAQGAGAQAVQWPEPGALAAHEAPQHPGEHGPAQTYQDPYGYAPAPDPSGAWHFADAPDQAQGVMGAPTGGVQDGGQPAAPDVAGGWSIPVIAEGDLPDESGEFTATALAAQWGGGTPPATLPGGATAPWATEAGAGAPWDTPTPAERMRQGARAQQVAAHGQQAPDHTGEAPAAEGRPAQDTGRPEHPGAAQDYPPHWRDETGEQLAQEQLGHQEQARTGQVGAHPGAGAPPAGPAGGFQQPQRLRRMQEQQRQNRRPLRQPRPEEPQSGPVHEPGAQAPHDPYGTGTFAPGGPEHPGAAGASMDLTDVPDRSAPAGPAGPATPMGPMGPMDPMGPVGSPQSLGTAHGSGPAAHPGATGFPGAPTPGTAPGHGGEHGTGGHEVGRHPGVSGAPDGTGAPGAPFDPAAGPVRPPDGPHGPGDAGTPDAPGTGAVPGAPHGGIPGHGAEVGHPGAAPLVPDAQDADEDAIFVGPPAPEATLRPTAPDPFEGTADTAGTAQAAFETTTGSTRAARPRRPLQDRRVQEPLSDDTPSEPGPGATPWEHGRDGSPWDGVPEDASLGNVQEQASQERPSHEPADPSTGEAAPAPDAVPAPDPADAPEATGTDPTAGAVAPAGPDPASEDDAPEQALTDAHGTTAPQDAPPGAERPERLAEDAEDGAPAPDGIPMAALPDAGTDTVVGTETVPGQEPGIGPDEHPLSSYVLRVNGTDRPVTGAWIGESLLYVLRERLGLAGAKDGCSQGECGACNVQVDGRLVASCLVPAATTAGSEVRTVEGLAEQGRSSDVQRALADRGAVQCGFCVPGMAMTVHDLLEGNPDPSDLEARQALSGNLCRCSGYRGVLDAVRQVVGERSSAGQDEHRKQDEQGGGAPPDDGTDGPRIPHQAGPGAGGVHPGPYAPGTPAGYDGTAYEGGQYEDDGYEDDGGRA